MLRSPLNQRSISVVIPAYNCESFLSNAVRSVYEQHWMPWEVIVVDDGSTDKTPQVIRELALEFPRNNFIHSHQPNGGEASARNRGVSLATGDYIAFLDADDTWLPNKLEQQMQLFQRDPTLSLTFTAYTRIYSTGEKELICLSKWEATTEYALHQLVDGCCIAPSTVVVRRDALLEVGDFQTLPLGVDWEMWLRLAVAGHKMEYLPKPLTLYSWHGSNISSDPRKVGQAVLDILPTYFRSGKFPPSIQRLEHRCYARRRMIHACYCLEVGDFSNARRHIIAAMRTRPASIRPGWILILLRSLCHRS